ncbi:MAG: DMT family transporter [Candidatus Omnitrophota bacterium]
MSNPIKVFALSLLCLLWGINWVAIKMSLEGLPPFTSAGLRFLTASVIMFLYIKWKKMSFSVNGKEFKMLLICAFLTYVLDYSLIYWGEQYLSAGVSSIFSSTFVLFTALFTTFVFKNEPFSASKYTGLVIGFLGVLTIFYDQLIITRFSVMVILASAAMLAAAINAALSTVLVKKYLNHMDPVILSFYQLAMGSVFLAIMASTAENFSKIHLTVRVMMAVLYMGVAASAIAFVLFYYLLKHMSAISLSLTIYVIPLIALITDYFVYGEVLHWRSILGMIIIFTGIWLSQLNKQRLDQFLVKLKIKPVSLEREMKENNNEDGHECSVEM